MIQTTAIPYAVNPKIHTVIAPKKSLPAMPNKNRTKTMTEQVIGNISSYFLFNTAAHNAPPEEIMANHNISEIIRFPPYIFTVVASDSI